MYYDQLIEVQFAQLFEAYIAKRLNMPRDNVRRIKPELKKKHVTDFSAVAFSREFGINFSEIVQNTYLQLDLSGIKKDLRKAAILTELDGEKTVFTANPSAFATRILEHLGLLGCFSQIIGIENVGFISKRDVRSYQIVEKLTGLSAEEIYFCDDSIENLNAAKERRWTTILYCPTNTKVSGHILIRSFEELLDL